MRLLDRDNAIAVAWGVVYAFALVLVVGTLDALGVAPTVTVPVVVVVLPIACGLAIAAIERRWMGPRHG
ncbi:MAG: hypothetical protein FJX56_12250 [Alphaproteobacteria bacterium]|nr:hypothetical protein [Alphaproteobacteria bacterium]